MHNIAAQFGDLQFVGHGVLHAVDVVFGDLAGALQRDLGLARADMGKFARHADIDLAHLGIGLQLRRGDGIARHARKLFRRVPIALGKAVVGYGARADDIAAVHAATLGDQRDDL